MNRRTRVVAAAAAGLVAVGVVAGLLDHRRDQEWQHGGDQVEARAELTATTPSGFGAALTAVGVPRERGLAGAPQMYVVQVGWEGSPDSDGTYQFILLDDRVDPARPIAAYGAWSDDGDEGPNWAGQYEVLADHYPWLARTASERTDGGWTNDTDALGVSARSTGDATLAFMLDRDDLPTTQPADDLLLAMVFVEDGGEVRWAKQVPLVS